MENLSNISVIRDVLTRHGFSFSKGLGQNFLINPPSVRAWQNREMRSRAGE